MMEVPDSESHDPPSAELSSYEASSFERAPGHGPEQILADLNWLRNLARALVHQTPGVSTAFADDACQEVYLVAHKKERASEVDGWQPKRAWLAGALRFVIARERRTNRRRQKREQRSARSEALPSTEELVARTEIQAVVVRELLALEEPFRSALLLRYQQGLSTRQIAERLDCKLDTVRWRVRRGSVLLRERLDEGHENAGRELALLAALPSPDVLAAPAGILTAGAGAIASGVLWMNVPVKIACAVVLTLLCGFFVVDSWSAAGPDPEADSIGPGFVADVHSAGSVEDRAAVDAKEARDGARVAEESVEAPRAKAATAKIVGRIVSEEDGSGIAGEVAVLWSKKMGTPLPKASCDSSGRFILETPLQVENTVYVLVSAGLFRTQTRLQFGGRGNRPTLTAGTHDVGTIKLAIAGAVRGRVSLGDGRGLKEALVSYKAIGGQKGYQAVEADHDGNYSVPGLRPGRYQGRVMHPGSTQKSVEVEVRAGAESYVDYVLEKSPTVEGRVLDQEGKPVKGLRLDISSYWTIYGTRTDAQGRFVCPTGSEEPQNVQILDRAEWALDAKYANGPYEPGARDVVVRVVSKVDRRPKRSLLVVDAVTGEPVERFGVATMDEPEPGRRAWGRTRRRQYRGGVARVSPRHPKDVWYIQARGYADAWGKFDETLMGSKKRQRVELKLRPSIVGRVVVPEGEGIGDYSLRLKPAYEQTLMKYKMQGDTSFLDRDKLWARASFLTFSGYGTPYMVTAVNAKPPQGRMQFQKVKPTVVRLADDGSFEVKSLQCRPYRLELVKGDRVVAVRDTVRLVAARATNVGDLEPRRPATLHGVLRYETDASLAGHRISLHADASKSVTVKADGRFSFGDLHGQHHYLVVEPSREAVQKFGAQKQDFYIRLTPGKAHEGVSFVMQSRPMIQIAANVYLRGATAPKEVGITGRKPYRHTKLKRKPGSPALFEGSAPFAGAVHLELRFAGLYVTDKSPIQLAPRGPGGAGARQAFERHVVCAALDIVVPSGRSWPAKGQLEIELRGVAADGHDVEQTIWIHDREISNDFNDYAKGRVRLPSVPVGDYRAKIRMRGDAVAPIVWYSDRYLSVREGTSNVLGQPSGGADASSSKKGPGKR